MPEAYLQAALGASEIGLKLWNDVDLGSVTYEDEETANIWADVNTQLRRRTSKLREMHVTIRLKGSGKDDLIDQENALRDELGTYPNTLVVQPRNASRSTTWTVLRGPAAVAPFDTYYEKGNIGYYDTVLICEPWGYGPSETPLAAYATESPALIDLGTLVGQGEPPLTVDLARSWGTDGDGIGIEHAVVALAQTEAAISDYVFDSCSVVRGDWADGADAGCASGHYAKLATDDVWDYLDVFPTENTPPGRYRILVRAKTSSSVGDNFVAMRKQVDGTRDPKTKTKVRGGTVWGLYDMGEIAVHAGFGAVRLYGYGGSGYLGVDRLYLVPIDWAWMRYADAGQATASIHFGWLYDQTYTLTDGATTYDATARMFGHGLKCGREGYSLMVLVEQMNGNDPTPDFTLDVSYRPRWESLR